MNTNDMKCIAPAGHEWGTDDRCIWCGRSKSIVERPPVELYRYLDGVHWGVQLPSRDGIDPKIWFYKDETEARRQLYMAQMDVPARLVKVTIEGVL